MLMNRKTFKKIYKTGLWLNSDFQIPVFFKLSIFLKQILRQNKIEKIFKFIIYIQNFKLKASYFL